MSNSRPRGTHLRNTTRPREKGERPRGSKGRRKELMPGLRGRRPERRREGKERRAKKILIYSQSKMRLKMIILNLMMSLILMKFPSTFE